MAAEGGSQKVMSAVGVMEDGGEEATRDDFEIEGRLQDLKHEKAKEKSAFTCIKNKLRYKANEEDHLSRKEVKELWGKLINPQERAIETMVHLSIKDRTSLWKNQTSWEMKIFNPLQILHVVRRSGGMHKNALFKGRSTLVAMVTTAACSRPGASFSYKNVAKKEWNVYFSISS